MRKDFEKPPSFWKKYGKNILIFELGIVSYSFAIYYRLNTSEGLRYNYSKKYPTVLKAYYEVGERIGGLDTRQTDQERWKSFDKTKD